MARVANVGFETQSTTSGVEVTVWSGAGATLETTTVRSGSASLKVTTTTGTRQGIVQQWRSATATGPFYVRFGLYIGTAPTSDNVIAVFSNGALINSGAVTDLILTSSRTLKLQYVNGSSVFVDVGSPSSALNTGQWYQIFMKFDATGGAGAGVVEAKIDGNAAFATATNATFLANVLAFRCGTNLTGGSDTTGVVYFDDIAINDSAAGTGQTGYPTLNEKLVMARPTGAGDNAAEVGTASSINEVPVTDTSTGSTNRIELQTTTSIGDYAMTDSSTMGLASTDIVTLVAPYARVAGATSTSTNYQLRVKSAASGTLKTSTLTTITSASFFTNPSSNTSFLLQDGVAYVDPTTSAAWTPTGTNSIDNMQVGVTTTDGNPDVYVTWLGAYVGYTPSAPPTVTLNTPADAGTVSTTTPELDFTGTDAQSDDITYEVQIDTVNTFNGSGGGTIDSYSESNQNSGAFVYATNPGIGQSLTGNGSTIGTAKFYLKKTGSPTGNAVAKIYNVTGTPGTNAKPSGAALATSDNFDVSTLTTSYQLITFTFSAGNQIALANGTDYIVTFEYTGGDLSNAPLAGYAGPGSDGGNISQANNVFTWTGNQPVGGDLCFYVIAVASPLLDKLSNTDAGFADITNGADTDPFASGNQIGYTVQAGDALTNSNTYYWRVRGKDPSGTNTYGAWATTRSFTVSVPTGIPNKIRIVNQSINRGSTY